MATGKPSKQASQPNFFSSVSSLLLSSFLLLQKIRLRYVAYCLTAVAILRVALLLSDFLSPLWGYYWGGMKDFQPVQGQDMMVLRDACFEKSPSNVICDQWIKPIGQCDPKDIRTEDFTELTVYGAGYDGPMDINRMRVNLRSTPIPRTHSVIHDHPAYFTGVREMGNPHHFLEEIMVVLYAMLHQTNRLFTSKRNALYLHPTDGKPHEYIENKRRVYDDLISWLPVEEPHPAYSGPINTCYRTVVVGKMNMNLADTYRPYLINDILTNLKIANRSDTSVCKPNQVTLIQRHNNRKILNMDEILLVLQNYGFPNAVAVDFASMTAREQVQLARCSSVLVGTQGAGLHWAFFMEPGAGLVEIAWPQQAWPFFYTAKAVKFLRVYNLYAHYLYPSHEALIKERKIYRNQTSNWQEIVGFQTMQPPTPWVDNVYKFADVVIPPLEMLTAVRTVAGMGTY